MSTPSSRKPSMRRALLLSALALPLGTGLAMAKVPDGWHKAGDRPNAYDMDLDPAASYGGKPSARIKSKDKSIEGFGTLMQTVDADAYRGKRVRLTGNVKTENLDDWTGLWMRVDAANHKTIAFDNMQSRPIKGTQNWQPYAVVLDVAPDAEAVAFGILVVGTGTAWLNQAQLEVVDNKVPVTASPKPSTPANLDFSK